MSDVVVTRVDDVPKSRRHSVMPQWVEEVLALGGAWARVDGVTPSRAQHWRKRARLDVVTREGVVYARAHSAPRA